MPSTTEITVSQLSRLIGLPQTPVIIDVRAEDEFAADPRRVPQGRSRPAPAVRRGAYGISVAMRSTHNRLRRRWRYPTAP